LDPPVPLILKPKFGEIWQYAESGSTKACEAADLSCYFVPHTKCDPHKYPWSSKYKLSPDPQDISDGVPPEEILNYQPYISYRRSADVYNYMTRPLEWLRKAIAEFVQEQSPPWQEDDTCTVIHVRRSDVVLGGLADRSYHPVQEYLNLLSGRERERIIIITDDQDAIDEALEFHSRYTTWHYIKRQRHSGATGGYENQLPSNDPKTEVVVIMATNQIIQQCNTLVRTMGNFGNMLENSMRQRHPHLQVLRVGDDPSATDFNAESVQRLKEYIEKKRAGEDVTELVQGFIPPSLSP